MYSLMFICCHTPVQAQQLDHVGSGEEEGIVICCCPPNYSHSEPCSFMLDLHVLVNSVSPSC